MTVSEKVKEAIKNGNLDELIKNGGFDCEGNEGIDSLVMYAYYLGRKETEQELIFEYNMKLDE